MIVFRGYLRMIKRNIWYAVIYLGIFFGIGIGFTASAEKGTEGVFTGESVRVGVVDEDGGAAAGGLTDYLKTIHEVTMLEGDKAALQENLFYQNVEYIVQIPTGFYEKCIAGEDALPVTKLPGSYTAAYVDQQIGSYLNRLKAFRAAGFSEEEAVSAAAELAGKKAEVTLLDTDGNQGNEASYLYYFRYIPYLFLAALCYIMGYMLMAFRKGEIPKRMEACAIPARRQTAQGLLAMFTLGAAIWMIGILGAVIFYQKDFLAAPNAGFYLLNTAVIMLVALMISYLIGMLVNNPSMLNGLANILSLGMSFLCGVFVPLDIMDSRVLTVSQFLPVYWYEKINETLSSHRTLSAALRTDIWKYLGIEAVFAVAILCVILAVGKYRRDA